LAAAANATGRIGDGAPALWFDNIRGFTDARVAMNTIGSWQNHMKVGDIVKTTVFVKDLNDFATVNATYEAFFTEHNATFPARSCV
ncbi:Rid family hydrolase, partial [Salmonella enterica subsp. enterica serovar Kentucky]|nr:Rid family hydrolase [Salmonella enterica subsp. enterica serovar Kentucky]